MISLEIKSCNNIDEIFERIDAIEFAVRIYKNKVR